MVTFLQVRDENYTSKGKIKIPSCMVAELVGSTVEQQEKTFEETPHMNDS